MPIRCLRKEKSIALFDYPASTCNNSIHMKNRKKKIRIVVLFGGKSAEHDVSIQSAKNVVESLDKNKYELVLIGIDKKGTWHQLNETFLCESTFDHQQSVEDGKEVSVISKGGNSMELHSSDEHFETIDVVFPLLHGPFGEDGTIQGALKLMNVPFVGAGVLGSAVGMDKDVSKRLLRDAGVPTAKFLVFHKEHDPQFSSVVEQLGLPLFVKPTNLGSSIGVNKVATESEFVSAIKEAFLYDTKIIIEEYIEGREMEISVLGNEYPIVSLPGEIIATHAFYDYEAKYVDENGATLEIPAKISQEKIGEMQALTKKTFKALCLEGMARIDYFLTKEGRFYINEVNTIPGFTSSISMYPKLWKASGLPYAELIDRLIQLAIDRHERQQKLRSSR